MDWNFKGLDNGNLTEGLHWTLGRQSVRRLQKYFNATVRSQVLAPKDIIYLFVCFLLIF